MKILTVPYGGLPSVEIPPLTHGTVDWEFTEAFIDPHGDGLDIAVVELGELPRGLVVAYMRDTALAADEPLLRYEDPESGEATLLAGNVIIAMIPFSDLRNKHRISPAADPVRAFKMRSWRKRAQTGGAVGFDDDEIAIVVENLLVRQKEKANG